MKLKKALTGIDVFSIAAGAMISSGIFVLPAIAYGVAGSGILAAYFFAGIVMLPAVFSKLELSTAIPKAGGTYFFVERILGTSPGVVAGFANWFSISLKSAFALVGIGVFATLVFPGLTGFQIKLIAVGACVFFTILNLVSVKSTGRLQVVMVMFLLIILTQFVLFGYRVMDFSRLSGVLHFDWDKVWIATGIVFISYGGLTKVASVSEEVRNPQKNLVWGEFSAFIIVQLMYLLVVAVLIGVLPPEKLKSSLTPVSAAGLEFAPGKLLGNFEFIVTAVAAMLAFITTASAGIMAASRVPLSMSRDGLLTPFFGKVSQKHKIPRISIVLTSLFMLLIILVLDIENLAKVASLFMILLFILVNISVIVVRVSKIANYKPSFKSPFFPVTQIIGIGVYIFLIIKMGMLTVLISLGLVLLSIIWYFLYARKKVARKSAFVHMVKRITVPELVIDELELEKELLDILIERNEIVEDRFDSIIRQATILDFDHTMERDALFQQIGEIVGEKWEIDPVMVQAKLQKREEDTSTLIYPGVAVPHAIPHVIIEGKNAFDIILVRNKFGIKWNDAGEVVYTAFCLIGSIDERNFHLRALMAIAQILQDPDFHREWMQARNEKELRSVILLSKRKRD